MNVKEPEEKSADTQPERPQKQQIDVPPNPGAAIDVPPNPGIDVPPNPG